jgi:hypothetical protein
MTTQSSLTPDQVRAASAMGVLWMYQTKGFSGWTGPVTLDYLPTEMAIYDIVPFTHKGHITLHNGTSERPEGMDAEAEIICKLTNWKWWETCTYRAKEINWRAVQYYIELPKVSK